MKLYQQKKIIFFTRSSYFLILINTFDLIAAAKILCEELYGSKNLERLYRN